MEVKVINIYAVRRPHRRQQIGGYLRPVKPKPQQSAHNGKGQVTDAAAHNARKNDSKTVDGSPYATRSAREPKTSRLCFTRSKNEPMSNALDCKGLRIPSRGRCSTRGRNERRASALQNKSPNCREVGTAYSNSVAKQRVQCAQHVSSSCTTNGDTIVTASQVYERRHVLLQNDCRGANAVNGPNVAGTTPRVSGRPPSPALQSA